MDRSKSHGRSSTKIPTGEWVWAVLAILAAATLYVGLQRFTSYRDRKRQKKQGSVALLFDCLDADGSGRI